LPASLVLELSSASNREALDFKPAFPGVSMALLYRDSSGSSAAILRYEPGSRVGRHRHPGYEHIYVLDGSQRDERGVYTAGTLVINPPGTEHSVESPEGCVVLAVWQIPVEFL
jgi:anti-sigma factor ChrR (cupin superfamily)